MVAATQKGKALVVSRQATLEQLAEALNMVIRGRLNCVGKVTLVANATSTPVTAANVGQNNIILLFPASATAAAAATSAYVAEASVIQGGFTITHNSTADLDRTFFYLAMG